MAWASACPSSMPVIGLVSDMLRLQIDATNPKPEPVSALNL
jgi:hypothetical protein